MTLPEQERIAMSRKFNPHHAQNGDRLVDERGREWVVVGLWNQPAVIIEACDDHHALPAAKREQKTIGVFGLSWHDYTAKE